MTVRYQARTRTRPHFTFYFDVPWAGSHALTHARASRAAERRAAFLGVTAPYVVSEVQGG